MPNTLFNIWYYRSHEIAIALTYLYLENIYDFKKYAYISRIAYISTSRMHMALESTCAKYQEIMIRTVGGDTVFKSLTK